MLRLCIGHHMTLFQRQRYKKELKLEMTLPLFHFTTLAGIRTSLRRLASEGLLYIQPISGHETTAYPIHYKSLTRGVIARCTAAAEREEAWDALREVPTFNAALVAHTADPHPLA